MSGRIWVYSDPHFYHKNICRFESSPGVKLRPWDDVEQMTEDMIKWYNEMVDDGDRVYILGDVAFSATNMRNSVGRLKGRKVLVKGNHDPDNHRQMYQELFDDIRGYVQKNGFIMSHIPIHPASMSRWKLNIHGHLHDNSVEPVVGGPWVGYEESYDPRYFCACVEQTNFRPILLDDILKQRHIV